MEDFLDYVGEVNPLALVADGLDDAIIGIAERCSMAPLVVYDVDKIIEILITRDGMTDEEAIEYYSYNIAGAYMGEGTPLFLTRAESEFI